MKNLLSVVMLTTSACFANAASLGPYVVGGSGRDCEAAKKVAFVRAIEYAVGSAIITEKQSVDNRLTRDDLLTHSAGFIRDNYEVLNSIQNGTNCEVKVRVYVDGTMINDHILHTSKDTKNIEGTKIGDRIQSYLDMQNTGDNLIDNVLKDYPTRAYNVKQSNFTVNVDSNRKVTLQIPYTLTMNKKYLEALGGALKQVKDKDCTAFCWKTPSVKVSGETYYFNDVYKPKKVYDTFAPFMMIVSLNDITGKALKTSCIDTSTILAPMITDGPGVKIYGDGWSYSNTIILDISNIQNRMRDVDNIDMKIVRLGTCR